MLPQAVSTCLLFSIVLNCLLTDCVHPHTLPLIHVYLAEVDVSAMWGRGLHASGVEEQRLLASFDFFDKVTARVSKIAVRLIRDMLASSLMRCTFLSHRYCRTRMATWTRKSWHEGLLKGECLRPVRLL